jgi:Tol biopolymer transport system component
MRMTPRAGLATILTSVVLTTTSAAGPASAATIPGVASGGSHIAEAAQADGRILLSDAATGQLYTVNPDGSALMQVTHLGPGQHAFDAEWAPHSKRIIFASDMSGDNRIYLMNADGTHVHLVASDRSGYADDAPSFTPDGHTIVFTRCRPDPPGGCSIAGMRADGTDRHALTNPGRGDHQHGDFYAEVSPNGRRVTFSRFRYNGVTARIWAMRIDGSHAHPVTAPALEAEISSWAPDGRHLLFTDLAIHLGSKVYSVRPDGSHLTPLTSSHYPHSDVFQSVAPAGDRIAFTTDRNYPDLCCRDLYVMNADGSGQHIVPTGLTYPLDPQWGTAPTLPDSATNVKRSVRVPPARHGMSAAEHLFSSYVPHQWP